MNTTGKNFLTNLFYNYHQLLHRVGRSWVDMWLMTVGAFEAIPRVGFLSPRLWLQGMRTKVEGWKQKAIVWKRWTVLNVWESYKNPKRPRGNYRLNGCYAAAWKTFGSEMPKKKNRTGNFTRVWKAIGSQKKTKTDRQKILRTRIHRHTLHRFRTRDFSLHSGRPFVITRYFTPTLMVSNLKDKDKRLCNREHYVPKKNPR